MNKSKKGYFSITSNNIFMLKLLFKICPGRVLATLLQSLVRYFGWVFYSVIFIDFVLSAFDEQRSFKSVFLFISTVMVIFMLSEVFMAWYNQRYKLMTEQKIYYQINKIVFDKANAVDISCYENPDFYNNYTKAISEANGRALSVLESISDLLVSIFSFLYVVFTMYELDKLIAVLTIFPVIGSLIFGKYINKTVFDNNMDDIPHNRRMDYVNRALFLQKFAKEIRLSRIFNILKKIYEKSYNGIIKNVDKYKKKLFTLNFLRDFLCYPVVFESVWLYSAFRAIVIKDLSLSECVVLANAMIVATNMLLLVMRSIVSLSENGIYIKNLRAFLNYREKISENQDGLMPESKAHTLEFRNVSFSYEGQNEPVLKNLNFVINSSEKVALVGHNGAGKTTLVKLIMRLYDATEGEILLNGINIKEYNLKEYRKLFGTVFQDFQILSMTALENVSMSEIENEEHRSICMDAMKKSGVYEKMISLKNGVDTILTREFDDDGAVLSGGENQKIAVSRVYAKPAGIVILDEPSSALDPISEYKMYELLSKTFRTENRPKIVILISHRLSSAILADTIYVLENGEIVERGSHEQLLKINGKYGDMFRKQAQNYLDESVLESAAFLNGDLVG